MRKVWLIPVTLIAIFFASCKTPQQPIVEDFHTKTYVERMKYFEENPLKYGQIVFLGNSLTQGGKWETYLPGKNIANRGISGDNTEGILARLDEIVKSKPSKLFIEAGVNDISLNRSNEMIIDNYRKIIKTIKQQSPSTQICITSVFPINKNVSKYKRLTGKESQILELNKQLKKLAKKTNAQYVDVFPQLMDDKGMLRKEYTADGLHLTTQGYEVWRDKLLEYIQ